MKTITKKEKKMVSEEVDGVLQEVEKDIDVEYIEKTIKQEFKKDEYIQNLQNKIEEDDLEIARRTAHKVELQAELDSIK